MSLRGRKKHHPGTKQETVEPAGEHEQNRCSTVAHSKHRAAAAMPAGVDACVSRVQVHAVGLPEESPCGRRKVGGGFSAESQTPCRRSDGLEETTG